MSLSISQQKLYSRQIILEDIGTEGQNLLLNSKVGIVGLGGLGSAASMYLTSLGIGTLKLFDYDEVEESNLQRQIVHNWGSIGMDKVDSALESLKKMNPSTKILIDKYPYLKLNKFKSAIEGLDVVVDCTDNFESRFMINQACFQNKVPLVSGAAIRFEGQLTSFNFKKNSSPCYQCLYPPSITQETCDENGVFSPVVGIIGSMQALETAKMIVGMPVLVGNLLLLDAKTMHQKIVGFSKDSSCPICSNLS